MKLKEVARSIGMPLDKWGGHCYQVVAAFLDTGILEGAEPVTGYFFGPDPDLVTDHAWLKLPDGRICDPTRFWIEDRPPYIYFGPQGREYDEGGERWNQEIEKLGELFKAPKLDLVAAFDALQGPQD